jgi:hypothetical protein
VGEGERRREAGRQDWGFFFVFFFFGSWLVDLYVCELVTTGALPSLKKS